MDVLRKKICIEKSRSRTQGILPYIRYNGDSGQINYVFEDDVDGNWGEYVCDYAMVKTSINSINGEEASEDSLNYVKKEILKNGETGQEQRIRYCDIIRRYNFVQEVLRNSVYVKAVTKNVKELSDGCSNIYNDVPTLTFTTNFSENKDRYEFIPLDINLFSKDDKDVYVAEEGEYAVDNFYVLMPNIEEVSACTEWWNTQWENMGGREKLGEAAQGSQPLFYFCKDVENFVIGKITIPFEYTGSMVPDYMFYSEIKDYLKWFETHTEDDPQWAEHGGNEFKEYLESIEPRWTQVVSDNEPNEGQLAYTAPFISFNISLDDEYDYGGVYEAYITEDCAFSIEKMKNDYVTMGGDSGFTERFSAMKPMFNETSAMVESKLAYVRDKETVSIEGVLGTWKTFEINDNAINLFKCTKYEADSSFTGKGITRKYYNQFGRLLRTETEGENEVPPYKREKSERLILESVTPVPMDSDIETVKDFGTPIDEEDDETETEAVYTTGYTVFHYVWWKCKMQSKTEAKEIKCADGEAVTAGESKYRTVTLLECFPKLIPTADVGDTYYFMSKYDNGAVYEQAITLVTADAQSLSTFEIPYHENTFYDMYLVDEDSNTYVGNYIPQGGITKKDGFWTIDYVIGGQATLNGSKFTPIPNTGIHYRETYKYEPAKTMKTYIDGLENITIYYDSIDTESSKETVYSDDYRLHRKTNKAMITGMEVGTTWNENDAIYAPVFARSGIESLQESPKETIDISFDRGAAAAFESHFKLTECNTFEDLENYGNNYFNL